MLAEPLPDSFGWARATLIAWEKLRLFYNLILLPWGILLLAIDWRSLILYSSLVTIIGGAVAVMIASNLMYFLGPLGELYLTVLFCKRWPSWLRLAVFAAGLLVTGMAFIGFILAALWNLGGGFR